MPLVFTMQRAPCLESGQADTLPPTMGIKGQKQRKVSSFNPAWCLRPPPVKATTPRITTSNSSSRSPLPSAYRGKKSHHYPRQDCSELAVEPTSPRVGCMGQIRRCRAPPPPSGATGLLHSSSSSSSSSRSSSVSPAAPVQLNSLMLKKDMACSLYTSSSSSRSSLSASPSSIPGEFSLLMLKKVSSRSRGVSFEEMDPPRPVEKKVAAQESSASLWKRRCSGGGDGLRVQLQALERLSV